MALRLNSSLPLRALVRKSLPLGPLGSIRALTSVSGDGHADTASTASPLQETENIKEINRLMLEVRTSLHKSGSHVVLKMPTRLAPKRSWAEEARVRALESGTSTPTSKSSGAPGDLHVQLDLENPKPKRMHESYVELSLPFSSDPELLEKYIATSGGIRIGKVFEDLDTLAGTISYQHALGSQPVAGDSASPIFIVTASVDRLDLLQEIVATEDYLLSGQVIFVGSSSMEVLVTIQQMSKSGNITCLTGRFTMATRNAITGKSQKIAPLDIRSEAERTLFAMGQEHKDRKRLDSATSLERVPPTQEEARLLHDRFLEDRKADSAQLKSEHGVVPVSQSRLLTTMHMHPQSRNVHMKIFGGFLMRASYELAWMCAAAFTGRHVAFLSLDALAFHSPVPIGAMLLLSSQITFTSNGDDLPGHKADAVDQEVVAAVSVLAEVVDLETGEKKRTNTFQYSFNLGTTQKRVSPDTYREAMQWLEGRRRVELGRQVRSIYAGVHDT